MKRPLAVDVGLVDLELATAAALRGQVVRAAELAERAARCLRAGDPAPARLTLQQALPARRRARR